jgi:hypothetical protein
VQLLVPPPKYHVQRLLPGVELKGQAKLAGLFIIERGGSGNIQLDHREAMDVLMSNCEDAFGFPPYHAIESFLCNMNGRDLRTAEADLVSRAFDKCPAILLRSENLDWWQRIPGLVEAL